MPELRDLPAIETLMQSEAIAALVQDRGATIIKKRLREIQAQMRETRNVPQWATSAEGYAAALDTISSAGLGNCPNKLFTRTANFAPKINS